MMIPVDYSYNIFAPFFLPMSQSLFQQDQQTPKITYYFLAPQKNSNSIETIQSISAFSTQNGSQYLCSTVLMDGSKENRLKTQNERGSIESPLASEQLSESKQKWKQKFGRNIKSNIFMAMIKFLLKNKSMKIYTKKVIQRHNLTLKFNEFYKVLKMKQRKLKGYVSQPEMATFFLEDETLKQHDQMNQRQNQFRLVFRILAKLYFKIYHIPYVFNTRKIKKVSKTMHLVYLREKIGM